MIWSLNDVSEGCHISVVSEKTHRAVGGGQTVGAAGIRAVSRLSGDTTHFRAHRHTRAGVAPRCGSRSKLQAVFEGYALSVPADKPTRIQVGEERGEVDRALWVLRDCSPEVCSAGGFVLKWMSRQVSA